MERRVAPSGGSIPPAVRAVSNGCAGSNPATSPTQYKISIWVVIVMVNEYLPDVVIGCLRPSVRDSLRSVSLYRRAMKAMSRVYICRSSELFVKPLPRKVDWGTALAFVDGELLGMPKHAKTLSLVEEAGRIYVVPTVLIDPYLRR